MQMSLHHETTSDALREVIQACGGFKEVGSRLWPDISPERAAGNLRDCINSERRERLTPDQVLFVLRLGRDAGCHAGMLFFAREAGYSDPQPIEPADERAQLMREYVEAAKSLSKMAQRIERLHDVTSKAA